MLPTKKLSQIAKLRTDLIKNLGKLQSVNSDLPKLKKQKIDAEK